MKEDLTASKVKTLIKQLKKFKVKPIIINGEEYYNHYKVIRKRT